MARMHEYFQWDQAKAEKNLQKHKISFEDIAAILANPLGDLSQLELEDNRQNYGEQRIITFVPNPNDHQKLYVVVWTPREDRRGQVTRIISARPANRKERDLYEHYKPTS